MPCPAPTEALGGRPARTKGGGASGGVPEMNFWGELEDLEECVG